MGSQSDIRRRAFLSGSGAMAVSLFAGARAHSQQVTYPGVYVEELTPAPSVIKRVSLSGALFVDDFGMTSEKTFTSYGEFAALHAGVAVDPEAREQIRLFFVNGGRRAATVDVKAADLENGSANLADLIDRRGDAGIGLVAAPIAARIPPSAAGRAYAAALVAAKRKHAMLLIDAPKTEAAFDAQSLVADWRYAVGLFDRDAAMFAPRLSVSGSSAPSIAASGAVAGVIARTDAAGGVWKAPAGFSANILGAAPEHAVTNAEQDFLTAESVNLIRTFPSAGPVIWGSRTLSQDPEWRYVAVRRLSNMIEKSVDKAMTWTAFERNEELLWLRIRSGVEAFMNTLFRDGALPGASTNQAFFVQCGSTTMTQTDIDNGVVNLQIGFAPLRPAEFVIIKMTLKALAA